MAEPTHTPSRSTDRRSTAGWCHWHKGPSQTAVLVDAIERISGPPARLYACTPCREQRGLTPLAGRPAILADKGVQS
jgi:hypothetical protein